MSFASGSYIAFCWRLTRSRTHIRLLRMTLLVFLVANFVILLHAYFNHIGFEGRSFGTMLLHVLVLLDKLAELGRGRVPEHKFQQQPFFAAAVFKRFWWCFFTESNAELSRRLMDALWRGQAGDMQPLRDMLEKE